MVQIHHTSLEHTNSNPAYYVGQIVGYANWKAVLRSWWCAHSHYSSAQSHYRNPNTPSRSHETSHKWSLFYRMHLFWGSCSAVFALSSTTSILNVIQYSHDFLGRGAGFGLLTTYQPVMQCNTLLCKSNISQFGKEYMSVALFSAKKKICKFRSSPDLAAMRHVS